MPRVNEFLAIGRLPSGPLGAITDVPGVLVGHASIEEGRLHTGVTAVLPHGQAAYRDKVSAASAVLNGFGKSIGRMQVALFAARTMEGRDGHVMPALPVNEVMSILRRHGVAVREP